MFCKSFDYNTADVKDGKFYGIAELYTATEPSTFPTTGEGMTGRFPADPEECVFLPTSTIYVTGTSELFMLNDEYDWDKQ